MSRDIISSEEAKKLSVDVLLKKLSATKTGLLSTEAEKSLQICMSNSFTHTIYYR